MVGVNIPRFSLSAGATRILKFKTITQHTRRRCATTGTLNMSGEEKAEEHHFCFLFFVIFEC